MKWMKLIGLWKTIQKIRKQLELSRLNSRKFVAGIVGVFCTLIAMTVVSAAGASEEAVETIAGWLVKFTGGYIGLQALVDFFGRLTLNGDQYRWTSRKFWLTAFVQGTTTLLLPILLQAGVDEALILSLIEKLNLLIAPLVAGLALVDVGGKFTGQ